MRWCILGSIPMNAEHVVHRGEHYSQHFAHSQLTGPQFVGSGHMAIGHWRSSLRHTKLEGPICSTAIITVA